jgi:hypothetical protein
VASGLLLGLAALTREVPLYFLPLLAAWLVGRRDRQSLLRAVVVVVATAAVVAPWTLRNWVRFGAFVPVSTMGGRALWEGNTLDDHGELYAEHLRLTREEGPVAAYRHAMREGRRAIRERQPRWILDKTVGESCQLFTPVNMAVVHIEKGGYGPPRPAVTWLVAAVTVLPYVAAMALFIGGLARIRWARARALLLLFLGFYLLVHIAVLGHHRFRLALLPVIFTVGASVLPGVGDATAPWNPLRRLVASALLAAFLVCVVLGVAGFLREPAFGGAGQDPPRLTSISMRCRHESGTEDPPENVLELPGLGDTVDHRYLQPPFPVARPRNHVLLPCPHVDAPAAYRHLEAVQARTRHALRLVPEDVACVGDLKYPAKGGLQVVIGIHGPVRPTRDLCRATQQVHEPGLGLDGREPGPAR